jgi:hypothetical protein
MYLSSGSGFCTLFKIGCKIEFIQDAHHSTVVFVHHTAIVRTRSHTIAQQKIMRYILGTVAITAGFGNISVCWKIVSVSRP